jgi:hypothetical protein
MRKIILMMPVSLDGFIEDRSATSTGTRSTTSCTANFNEQLGAMGYAVPQLGHWAL